MKRGENLGIGTAGSVMEVRLGDMARHDSSKSRVTPKGTRSTPPAAAETNPSIAHPEAYAPSPRWVPMVMFGLLIAGVLLILLNYLAPIPGAPSNWYLLAGLGLVLAGLVTATRYR